MVKLYSVKSLNKWLILFNCLSIPESISLVFAAVKRLTISGKSQRSFKKNSNSQFDLMKKPIYLKNNVY